MKRFSIAVLAIFIFGCSSDEGPSNQVTKGPEPVVEHSRPVPEVTLPEGKGSPEWMEVKRILEEPLIRLAYQDKSGLWDNEFEYLREQETYDEYIAHGEISWANVDSMLRVDINDIAFFDTTASIECTFVMLGADGNEKQFPQALTMYKHRGRWIKPYMTALWRQQEYEDLIKKAEEDSEEW